MQAIIDGSAGAPAILASERTTLRAWAHALIGIGRGFANSTADRPMTLALSLPTLEYAAPLVAAGYVSARAERLYAEASTGRSGATLDETRFEQLCAMKPNSPIYLELRGRVRK